ncbi:TatD family hydrolase [Haladaptatus sp. DYF46]|uniref:TatD family hydrolase n=1 Tax=Haladaptatus sp. DYF46 TaxID=2886041 RepID=UPI001E3D4B45|nr:TatD family hydrolase [Haladaptatus sp. DYF46]
MPSDYPTRRPTDAEYLSDETVDLPSSLLNLPWIDCHNHAQTLSWEDRERYALSGCQSMVMVASGYHWTPYKPVVADDVRFLWDDAINRRRAIETNHFFEANLAVGVHTGVRIENPDELLAAMDEYCRLDEVVALGETGITPSQHVESWGVDEQRAVVQAQMELADEHDLPIILHTPNRGTGDSPTYRVGASTPGYEKNASLASSPVITGDNPELEAVKIDVQTATEAGLAEERIVASHADPNNTNYLMEETECYLSFTVGYPWLTGVTAADVAETIREYGPDRILVETDCANILRTDAFSVKRTIFDLYRMGIDESDIRQVVLENPRDVFDLEE